MATSSCLEVKYLQNKEKEVVKSLEKCEDLNGLFKESVEVGLISQEVQNNFESLDWNNNVDCPRVIRYLLMHVYKSVEEKPALYNRWLEVLSNYCSLDHDTVLAKHISALTMHLAPECASKCNEIGIALNLPDSVRHDVRRTEHTDGCNLAFNLLLTKWVQGRYEDAKLPTLESLKEALRSVVVGRGSEASKLDSICWEELSEENPPLSKRSRPALDIIRQSSDTEVHEGRSTLLEVQAVTAQDESMHYQWLKNGKVLEGHNGNILCVDTANTSSKGSYQCIVSLAGCSSTSVIESRPISLKVCNSPTKKVLVARYCSEPEIPEDSWPPKSSNTYINLALIKQGDIDKGSEYARRTVQGNMDDVLADKEKIEYESVFTNLENSTRLIIEGRPGSGKTTLVHKFSKDWAEGILSLPNIKLLLLVHLRGFFNDQSICLRSILELYYLDESMIDLVTQQANQNNGEGLCFVLDGLDEYRPQSFQKTFIFKLIKRQVLPSAIVIVASRPAASHQFRRTASKHVEVIGFLKEQISEYVEAFFSDEDKRRDIHRYLADHPNVHHMCYLPIHAAMVCYLFDIKGYTLPRTETEMYTAFTCQTLFRTLSRDEESQIEQLESVDDLPEEEQKRFAKICMLSYEKTLSSKQVLKRSEVNDFFKDINCGRDSMGLITVDRMSRMCGFENLYTFLHLTFQEYLAALHLFKYSHDKLKELKCHGKKKHMQVVWKFYCGLENFTKKDPRFVALLESLGEQDSLFGAQCAFESQQSVVCDYVVEAGKHGTLSLKGYLTPSDLTAIGYVMKTATCPVKKLVLNKCKLGCEGVAAFFEEAGDKIQLVETLCFHGKDCKVEQFELLNSCLWKMSSLETLDLSKTNLGPQKNACLTAGIILPNLHTLKVSKSAEKSFKQLNFTCPKLGQIFFDDVCLQGNVETLQSASISLLNMGTETNICLNNQRMNLTDVHCLAAGLKHSASCISLNLAWCGIGAYGVKAIADCLQLCESLQELDLHNNNIGIDGTKALAKGLQRCNRLQILNLEQNDIGADGAKALAESLQHNSLQSLNFNRNNIGDDGAKALAEYLQHCKTLQTLSIHNNNVGIDGATAIIDSLQKSGNLRALHYSYNDSETQVELVGQRLNILDITYLALVVLKHGSCVSLSLKSCSVNADGAKALSVGLQHCNSLQSLNLWNNNINTDGAKALAIGLQYCNSLQTLDLWNNSIGADGAVVLAEKFKHCRSLCNLNLWENNIGTDGAKALVEGLQNCNNLQTLILGKNYVASDGAKALAEGLHHCISLQTLNLQNNCIGDAGAVALAESLQHWKNLETLYLQSNSIGDDGGKAIAKSLFHCSKLQSWDICDNDIRIEGARAILSYLQQCDNLQSLRHNIFCNSSETCVDLHGQKLNILDITYLTSAILKHGLCISLNLEACSITADGARVLSESLQDCHNLEIVELGLNNLGDDGTKALVSGLQRCSKLHTLNLWRNNIGDIGAMALAEGLQHCNSLHTLNLKGNNLSANVAKLNFQRCPNLKILHVNQIRDNASSL